MIGRNLLSDIRRVDSFLVSAARRVYAERAPDAGEFRGLFVTDAEFFELLDRPLGASLPTTLATLNGALPDTAGETDRWSRVQGVFGLQRSEADILLLCLLPELDLKYERIYGFLQDDVTAKRPTVDLLLGLLWPDLDHRLAARALFENDARLASQGLTIIAPPADGVDSLTRRTVQVATEVVRYLLEDSGNGQAPCVPYWRAENGAYEPSLYPPEATDIVSWLITSAEAPLWVHVRAQRVWTARALASDIAAWRGRPVIEVPLDSPEAGIDLAPRILPYVREALLRDAVILVRLADGAGVHDPHGTSSAWTELLEHPTLTVVWYLPTSVIPPLPASESVHVSSLDLPPPGYEGRLTLWERALSGETLCNAADLPVLAARYRLDGDQILAAARSAGERAWQRDPLAPSITFDDLAAASRGVSAARLGDLASQIVARHRWADLVLPADRIAQIHEMCDQFRYRHVVYDAWGFGRQSARGQGLSALFAGPSGTGKTMAAEVIANDLALDLYKIDLSGVVSKYIGETEKNLDRIFGLARDSNAILLFDEADALFGKRSETKDAHDRYANIEISYLLQKVEEYDGVVILTSNLRQNLDEAFMRRLQFSIEFPFPDETSRREIWERSAPTQLPLAEDVDMNVLATRFRLSGGSIRNALVNAAFLAARDGEVVTMSHLLWGVRREFQKLGKLVDEDDFPSHLPGRTMVGVGDGSLRRSGT